MSLTDQPQVELAEIAGFGDAEDAHAPVLAGNPLRPTLFSVLMVSVLQLRRPDEAPDLLSDEFQQALARWNRDRLSPRLPDSDWRTAVDRDAEMLRLQGDFLESLRERVSAAAATAPRDPVAFIAWFERLADVGPGQHDSLFPWLEHEASLDQMRWYLQQEAAGEAGFDDLTAFTQVKLPARVKLELARNYWDEMGRGNAKGMHGPMLQRLVEALDLHPAIEDTVGESLALANAMTAMATRRDYAWHALGALGVIELTAPARSAAVAASLKRLGINGKTRIYFDLHATLDVKHSAAWNAEAIAPAVAEDPSRATAIAEGALMRLQCGARCFERYRRDLW
jgi:pyrroloquinoline quinone (PQQ) biosynthesis protein C